MPTKYDVKTVKLDAAVGQPGQYIVPLGTAFRSFLILSLDGVTDFNLQIGTDQTPIPFIVPGMLFENSDPCDSESQGLLGTWAAQPGGSVQLLVTYAGGSFTQRQS